MIKNKKIPLEKADKLIKIIRIVLWTIGVIVGVVLVATFVIAVQKVGVEIKDFFIR